MKKKNQKNLKYPYTIRTSQNNFKMLKSIEIDMINILWCTFQVSTVIRL